MLTNVVAPPGIEPVAQATENVLFDPYVGREPPPPPRPKLAPAALAAALLALLPLGSLAAILVGIRGLRQTRLGTLRGRALAIGAIVAGSIFSIGYASAGVVVGMNYYADQRADQRYEDEKWQRKQAAREKEEKARRREAEERALALGPPKPVPPTAAPAPTFGAAPDATRDLKIGSLTVIDMGFKETSLKKALQREMGLAKAEGKEVLVMLGDGTCKPCAGVMQSLPDGKMQTALEKIRLVRIDIDVFKDDLSVLRYPFRGPGEGIPGFFLINGEAMPRDGIDGGEWGEDIADNIAPVLNPFVRGEFKRRKKPFRMPPPPAANGTPGGGTFL